MAIADSLTSQGWSRDAYGNMIPPSMASSSSQSSVTPGSFVQPGGMRSAFDLSPGYQQTANIHRQTYTAPTGGTFTRTGQSWGLNPSEPASYGAWQDQTGMTVSDPAAYSQMRARQQQGAGFEDYQNALTQALGGAGRQMQNYRSLLERPSAIQSTPGYQYALEQGNQAINRSAAAKGMLNSGNVLAELAKFGQGMASQNYQQQLQNQQQAVQQEMSQANALADLMRGAQQFGLSSGYYANPQGSTWYGGQRAPSVVGGGMIGAPFATM